MNFALWITIIGTFFSIIGAIIAIVQAHRAKKSANEANAIRQEFVQRRQMLEVSYLHRETNRIYQLVTQIGPRCSINSIKGKDLNFIAEEIEKYSHILNEHKESLPDLFKNYSNDPCSELNQYVEELSIVNTKDINQIKKIGKDILKIIQYVLPKIKSISDKKREEYHK